MKTLLVYGTRYGATESTSQEIVNTLQDKGVEVKVVDSKKEKVKDISPYNLVIVASGMKMGRWTKEPESFLQKYARELATKQVAIFVSSGARALFIHDDNQEEINKAWNDYLIAKTEKYTLNPVKLAIFGGIWNYNKMNFIERKMLSPFKLKLKEAGIEESKPGHFDTRNWDTIKKWVDELAQDIQK